MADNRDGTAAWVWPAVFCGYFAFQAIWRWVIGGGLGLDESQMFLWGQYLAWGYGPQPPLYSWLQWAAFHLIGDPLLALSLVKNAALCTTWLCVYALLRHAVPSGRAGLATLGLILLPQIAWESQRALSHSVLVTTLAALTCLVFWTRTLPGARGGYLLFGILTGLGLLSKANFALVPPALCLAAASMPELRRRISLRGLLVGAGTAALIVAGPALWAIRNRDFALASTHKLEQAQSGTALFAATVEGLGATLVASLAFMALPLVVAGLLFWRFRLPVAERPAPAPLAVWLLRVLITGLLLALLLVLFSGTTQVKDRWLQPVLVMSGPLIALWLLGSVSAAGRRWFAGVAGLCALLVTVALPIELLTGTPGNPARGGAPVERLVPEIIGAYPDIDVIIGDPEWVAANLQYREPAWSARAAHAARLAPGETALLVWNGDREEGRHLAGRIGGRSGSSVEMGKITVFAAPYPWQPEIDFEIHAAPIRRPE